MSLGLGDFDKDILHNQKPSIKKFPISKGGGGHYSGSTGYGNRGGSYGYDRNNGFPFPTDHDDFDSDEEIYIEDSKAVEAIVKATMSNLTEEEKELAIKNYYTEILKSKSKEAKIQERQKRSDSRQRLQEWLKYLLIFVSVLLLISLIAIVATVIYTSLTSNVMSETGLPAAIISFFSEIMRLLLIGN